MSCPLRAEQPSRLAVSPESITTHGRGLQLRAMNRWAIPIVPAGLGAGNLPRRANARIELACNERSELVRRVPKRIQRFIWLTYFQHTQFNHVSIILTHPVEHLA